MSIPARWGPSRPATRPRSVLFAGLALVLVALATLVVRPAVATESDAVDDTPAGSVVEVLPVTGLLDPPVGSTITRLLDQADADGAELVVLQVSGPGGVSIDTLGLVDAVRDADVPVAVLVAPQAGVEATAAGAWAALWAAADVRAVSEVGVVGPVQPVDLSQPPSEAVDDRVAELLGPEGQALLDTAMTAEQLEADGLTDVVAPDVATLLGDLDGFDVGDGRTLSLSQDDVQVRLHSLGLVSRMLHAAATPAFIYLLLVVGLSLLAFELFQPGFGVAGVAGLVMLPFAIFGLTVLPVAWWALALVLVGLGLFALDTALAGLGLTTLAATASFGVGSWFLFGTGDLRNPGWVAVATTVLAVGFWVVAMTTILRAQAGPEGVELGDLVGRPGIVRSILNPEGHVYIDEALWRARLDGSAKLRVGSPVRVAGVDGAVLVVEPFDPEAPSRPPAATASGPADADPPA
ncbi:NfeD family protein [Salsipaludibacter albus]|uniref:NfeD family protein n=1 Tax=Salsipaludibacter albus TaxID=2849650 RepID=UPI001EE41692|nr:NfeD family protein [Salsipaludibacter albus]MBY5161842.1 hypothetical protein [Salsipaludibacter albus]